MGAETDDSTLEGVATTVAGIVGLFTLKLMDKDDRLAESAGILPRRPLLVAVKDGVGGVEKAVLVLKSELCLVILDERASDVTENVV